MERDWVVTVNNHATRETGVFSGPEAHMIGAFERLCTLSGCAVVLWEPQDGTTEMHEHARHWSK